MGNRAVIAFGSKTSDLGIYLHWNGGIESVLAFLDAADQLGARDPAQDSYGIARLCQVIGNFFGGTNSIGIGSVSGLDCDNGDNGLFVVGPGFKVIERKFNRGDSRKSLDDFDQDAKSYYQGVLNSVLEKNAPPFKEAA